MRNYGGLLIALAISGLAGTALGQVDPELRELLQAGATQSFRGASPVAAYGYYYLNEPNFERTNVTLRLALAPVYMDSELGFVGLLGPHTDLGIGLAGGGFADNYYEFEHGKYFPEESFTGYGAGGSVSVYHLFNPGQTIPLSAVIRIGEHYATYARNEDDAPGFVLPPEHSTINWRIGLRLGGREPILTPELAGELSLWYSGQYRTTSGSYGFNGDRELAANSDLYWLRALLIYTLPESRQSFSINMTAGTSGNADRLSAYRLGGMLPLAAEFPLSIPGYFYEELSARNFLSFNGSYSIPLNGAKTWRITPMGAAAVVDYLPGTGQPGAFNSGVGLAIGYRPKSGRWQIVGTYGYGFEAVRDNGRGAQDVGVFFEYNMRSKGVGPTELDRTIGILPKFF